MIKEANDPKPLPAGREPGRLWQPCGRLRSDHLARYALNTAAANITLLVQAFNG
jgi:hypothetical protein